MSAILALGCLAVGFFVGWLWQAIFVVAQISRSQERMQQKVRYWQSEAAHARAVAGHLAKRLAASEGLFPDGQHWHLPGNQWEK